MTKPRWRRSVTAMILALTLMALPSRLLILAQPSPGELALDVDLFFWEVGVRGPSGEAVNVTVGAPDGTFLASGSGTLGPGGGAMVEVLSPAGDRVIPRPGDWVTATTASSSASIEIPPLEVGADMAVGDIFGKTSPYLSLTLVYDGHRWPVIPGTAAQGSRWSTAADKSGRFSFGLGSLMKLRNFDRFRLTLAVDRHTVARYVLTIALSVNQDRRRLVGRLEPFVSYDGELRRGATVMATATERTPYEGSIAMTLTDAAGNPLAVLPGDLVSVRAAAGLGTRETEILMPLLEIDLAGEAATASGKAPADGDVLLQLKNSALGPPAGMGPGGGGGLQRLTRAADGSFQFTWPGLAAFAPGSQVHMIYVFPNGNFVNFTRALSVLKVEAGGSYACGIGNAFDGVDLRLADGAGFDLARARGRVGDVAGQMAVNPDTSFVTRFAGGDGAPAAVEPGVRLQGRVGQTQIEAKVGDVVIEADWISRRVRVRYEGSGAEATAIRLYDIVGACLVERQALPASFSLAKTGDLFEGSLPAYGPGNGFTVVASDPQGIKVSRQARRAQAQIYIGTDRIDGLASPGAPVTVTWRSNRVAPVSALARAAMDSGSYRLRLGGPSGPAVIQAGDDIQLATAEESQTVLVEPLSAFFSVDFGVYGHAPARRTLRVGLFTELGETVFTTVTDAEGGYSLLPWNMMARLRRNMEDVRKMRVVLPTLGGHEIVVEEYLTPPTTFRAYVPTVMRNGTR